MFLENTIFFVLKNIKQKTDFGYQTHFFVLREQKINFENNYHKGPYFFYAYGKKLYFIYCHLDVSSFIILYFNLNSLYIRVCLAMKCLFFQGIFKRIINLVCLRKVI